MGRDSGWQWQAARASGQGFSFESEPERPLARPGRRGGGGLRVNPSGTVAAAAARSGCQGRAGGRPRGLWPGPSLKWVGAVTGVPGRDTEPRLGQAAVQWLRPAGSFKLSIASPMIRLPLRRFGPGGAARAPLNFQGRVLSPRTSRIPRARRLRKTGPAAGAVGDMEGPRRKARKPTVTDTEAAVTSLSDG